MLAVKFTNGEVIQGQPWNSLPNYRISNLKYKLGNKIIYFSGFESYNHLVEKMASIGGTPKTTKIFLCGRFKGKTQIVKIDFTTSKVETYISEEGNEYNGQITAGWKSGDKKSEPEFKIIESSICKPSDLP
ncbi:MAG: hypothetical protein AABY22_14910 [Nanoarchaeota archaeon]